MLSVGNLHFDIDIHIICQYIFYESTYATFPTLRQPLLPEMHESCMRWGLNTLYLSEAPTTVSTALRFSKAGLGSCHVGQMNGEFFELQIAREILATVRKCELPLQLDSLTEADGNCFPR